MLDADVTELDRELLRTAIVGIAVWVGIALAVVVLLLLFGDGLSSLLV